MLTPEDKARIKSGVLERMEASLDEILSENLGAEGEGSTPLPDQMSDEELQAQLQGG